MMHAGDGERDCRCRIDGDDGIIFAGGYWYGFALENEGVVCCLPGTVLTISLWGGIADSPVVHLYRILVESTGRSPITLLTQCASPEMRRQIDVTMIPLPADGVEFKCRIIRMQRRETVALRESGIKRSEMRVRICSFCKKINISDGERVETEVAIGILELFARPVIPGLTHGLCPVCYDTAMAEIQKGPADVPA